MKSVTWRSPSNIAIVKYWGKYANQIPANPSISFTLNNCFTQTTVTLEEENTSGDFDFKVYLDDELKPDFKGKIQDFLERLGDEAAFLKKHTFSIRTHNSFPHSSGIASSASGFSALALCFLSLKKQTTDYNENFYRKASIWARLGSGSACRSLYGGLVYWGENEHLPEGHNEYGVGLEPESIHQEFTNFRDYILLVELGSKRVSSTAGHGLMKNHPYAEVRFEQAKARLGEVLEYIKDGNVTSFGHLAESEALTLHAMMMTSDPYYLLMKPNTLDVIELIWQYRKTTGDPVFFTLDAGANVHLLFPAEIEPSVKQFVDTELKPYLRSEAYICDSVGQGPQFISSE